MKQSTITVRRKATPTVSIILPVNNKYPHFKGDEQKMKALLKMTEEKLIHDYPRKKADLLISDMRRLAAGIDYRNLSKGIGLFVSPYREKLMHFDFPVTEQVIVDKTFEIRDLYRAVKGQDNYLVVTLSERGVRLFRGYNGKLTEITNADMPRGWKDTGGKGHSRTDSFSSFASAKHVTDPKQYKDKLMEKFLRDVDKILSSDKSGKNSPLIVCGTERMTGHFAGLTKNKDRVLGYVHGNFDNATVSALEKKTAPDLKKMSSRRETDALAKLEDAIGKDRAVTGLRNVWAAAYNKNGRVLLVEKDFSCSATTGKKPDELIIANLSSNDLHYMSDAVDDAIELVIKYGGDVVFTGTDKLKGRGRIALITRY